MCVSQSYSKRSHGVFEHEYDARFPVVQKREFTDQEKEVALEKCKKANVIDRHLNICRDDLLYTGCSVHIDALKKLETKMTNDENDLQKN